MTKSITWRNTSANDLHAAISHARASARYGYSWPVVARSLRWLTPTITTSQLLIVQSIHTATRKER